MQVRAVASWRPRTRRKQQVYELLTWPDPGEKRRDICRSHHELGKRIGAFMRMYQPPEPWWLAVEDVVVFKNPKVAVIIARQSGLLAGPLEDLARAPSEWVKAADWRKSVLNMSHFTPRKGAKKATQQYLPDEIKRAVINSSVELGVKMEDIADAAGVSLWCAQQHPGSVCLGVDPGRTGAAVLLYP